MDLRVPFPSQPVEPNILAKWKAPLMKKCFGKDKPRISGINSLRTIGVQALCKAISSYRMAIKRNIAIKQYFPVVLFIIRGGFLVGVYHPVLLPLTLFLTKICNTHFQSWSLKSIPKIHTLGMKYRIYSHKRRPRMSVAFGTKNLTSTAP